jgi:[ribosomal protein S5]-alanine N-acetyltransferase
MKLRAVETSDGDALHAIFTESRVMEYLFDGTPPDRDATQGHVEAAITHPAWTIIVEDWIAGLVSLRPVADGDHELIIVLSSRWWGKGLAFSASQQAMRHGFGVLKLPRILATVDEPNARSRRLMTRLGFRPTGEGPGPKFRQCFYVATP